MAFKERVEALRINPEAIDRVEVLDGSRFSFPSKEGKFASVAIYTEITSTDGYISPEGAKQGLKIYGSKLRRESKQKKGLHTAIDKLEEIASSGKSVRVNIHRNNKFKSIPKHISERIPEIMERFGYHEDGTRDEMPGPVQVYDEQGIREEARRLNQAYSWVPGGFKNFFAVKALPNHFILKMLHQEGMGADCSSRPELFRAETTGLKGEEIMFTSNHKHHVEYKKAKELGAIMNLDDITHLEYVAKHVGMPKTVCFRYNPGPAREGNPIIGDPKEQKYGLRDDQLEEAIKRAKELGAERFGLHTMVVSNMLDEEYLIDTGRLVFEKTREIYEKTGIPIEFVNLGGGIGTAYKPEQIPVDYITVSQGVWEAFEESIAGTKLEDMKVFMECGRTITGPNGYLLMPVEHIEEKWKKEKIVGVLGSQANLMRPALYGAYHHISIAGKEDEKTEAAYDVVGGLCENCDKFAINRPLPNVEVGDTLVVHNTGAHSHAMGFWYNDTLRAPEVLVRPDDSLKIIRRHETKNDLYRTECLDSLDNFSRI